jgi:uncharacterized protein
MKNKACILGGLILLRACLMADSPSDAPELRGVLLLGGEKRFNLSNGSGAESAWLKVGETYAGWRLEEFDAERETLTLRKLDRKLEVRLAESKVLDSGATKGTPATLADAEAVMQKINLDEMLDKVMEQQKKMGAQISKQVVSQLGASAAQSEEAAALQAKVLEVLFPKESVDQMKKDITRIYSEVFTKEELQGLSSFYGTELGRSMIEKQPLVQQKTSEAMMPMIQKNMGKMKAVIAEFATEAKKRAEAGKTAPGGAP